MFNLIIIEGYLASGKSTFARRLSEAVNIPCFIKDDFKSAICAGIPINNREESKVFSAVTFDAMMYAAEKLLERDCSAIIEGNFVPSGIKPLDESMIIRQLISKYGCAPLTYKFFGDTRVLHKRFIEREALPERGRANLMFREVPFEEFDMICRSLDAFDVGGKVIKIDTTDFSKADFEKHIEAAKKRL